MKIEFTDVEKIYNLRRDVMRPGMDLSYVMYDEDNNEGSFHLAAVEDDKIVACITFFPSTNPDLPYENQYRMRALCTDENYRGRGYATQLINKGMEIVVSRGAQVVWFHARVHLVNFYRSFGCVEYGQPFPVKYSCMHINMYKVFK